MEIGDKVKAIWSDGLELTGQYIGEERGYVILIDENNKKIVCNSASVKFEVIE